MRWRPFQLTTPHLPGPRGWAAVHFATDKLQYAVARESDGKLTVVHEATAESPASLRQQIDPRDHHIVIDLACEDVLCRALRLPTTNETELRQMLDLQIDQLTPVPLDEVVYDFEPLERVEDPPAAEQARRGAGTLVLVAIARKSIVNERVAALEDAGLPPERVGVDALALFYTLVRRETIQRDERLSTLVWLHANVAHLVVYADGWPLLVRSVFCSGSAGWDTTLLGEELRRTQLAAQTEWPGRPTGPVLIVLAEATLEPTARALTRDWVVDAQLLTNGAVPSPASCLCSVTRGERHCNLLPDEWRQRRRASHLRRLAIRCGVGLGALYLLGLAGLVAANLVRKAQLHHLDLQRQGLRRDYVRAQQLDETLTALQKQLDTKYSALEALREVSLLMPPNLKLNFFAFRRDDTVTLKGQADAAQTVYDFIGRLEHCDLFARIKPGGVTIQGGLTKFELVATLKSAAGRTKGGG